MRSCASPLQVLGSLEPPLKPSPLAATRTNTSTTCNASAVDAEAGYLHALMVPSGNGEASSLPASWTNNTFSGNSNSDTAHSSVQQPLHEHEASRPKHAQPLLAKLHLPTCPDASAEAGVADPSACDRAGSRGSRSWTPSANTSLDSGSSQSAGISSSMQQPGTPALSAFAAVARCSTETNASCTVIGERAQGPQQSQAPCERVHSDALSASLPTDLGSAWQPQRSGSFTTPHESAAARRRSMQLQAYAGTTLSVRNGSPLANPRTPSGGVPAHGTLGNVTLGRSKGNFGSSGAHVSPRIHVCGSAATYRQHASVSGQGGSGAAGTAAVLRRSQTWDTADLADGNGAFPPSPAVAAAVAMTADGATVEAGTAVSCNRQHSSSSDGMPKQQHEEAGPAGTDDGSNSLGKYLPPGNGWAPLRVDVPSLTVTGSSSPLVPSAFAEHISFAAAAVAAGVLNSDASSATSHHASPSPRASERTHSSGPWSKLHLTRAKSIARPGSNGGSSRCSTPRSPQRHLSVKTTANHTKPSAPHDPHSPRANAPAASFWQLPWQRARPPMSRPSSGGGAPHGDTSSSGGIEACRAMEGPRHPTRLSEGGRLQQLMASRNSDASTSNSASNSGSIRSQRLSESGKLQQMAVEQLPDYMREQLDNGLGLPILIGSYGKEQQRRSPHRSLETARPILAPGPQRSSVDVMHGRDTMEAQKSM